VKNQHLENNITRKTCLSWRNKHITILKNWVSY